MKCVHTTGVSTCFVLCVSTKQLCLGLVYVFSCADKYKSMVTCVRLRLLAYNFVLNCARIYALLKQIAINMMN